MRLFGVLLVLVLIDSAPEGQPSRMSSGWMQGYEVMGFPRLVLSGTQTS